MDNETRKKVLEETLRFRQALPQLLTEHKGRWVVFRDGAVQSVHDSQAEALTAGLTKFGLDGGHVIAQVLEQPPVPVTAGAIYFAA